MSGRLVDNRSTTSLGGPSLPRHSHRHVKTNLSIGFSSMQRLLIKPTTSVSLRYACCFFVCSLTSPMQTQRAL